VARPEAIVDPELRGLVEQARAALRAGEAAQAVRLCATAYGRFLRTHPDVASLLARGGRLSPQSWPRLGTHVVLPPGGPPEVALERERFAFSEAATVYEFTAEAIVAGQRSAGPAPAGQAEGS
jgi:hypothetical protein